jgi:hypothetical protein
VPSDDIREKATAAFGNHQEKTGWLLAYFPGIKRTDLDPIAGQQLLVTFRDVDEKRHGVAVEFRYCKPGLHHIPGLGVPEVAKPVGVPLTTVHRRHFRNEAVLLDGHKYVECLFEDCAFKFNGKPYEIERGRRVGNHHVVTDNPVVNQTLKLVTELMTAIPLKPEGKIGNGEDEAERRTGLVGDAGWACADCGAYHINEDLWGRLLQNGEVGDMCPTCGFPPRGTSTIGGILAIGPRS